jgi:hypothetical protein
MNNNYMSNNEDLSMTYQLMNIPDRVLIPWHYDNKSIRPYPYCGKREIIFGPKIYDEDTGKRKFIHTNSRFFDITQIISALDEDDRNIDLYFATLEVTSTCFPKNLHLLKCPKIALIADTHHLMYPISKLVKYMKRETFDHLLMIAQPAHLHFFYEAGITHCAMLPREELNLETIRDKRPGVTYVGNRWKSSHIRRSRMVQFLEKKLPQKNIPFHIYKQLPKIEWLDVLRSSKMTVVSSLNGQFTPQIHACLAAETLCFVDELSPQTFLYHFFEPEKHFITWGDFDDLLTKIIFYHKHPKKAELIAKAGKKQAEDHFSENKSLGHIISDFVFNDEIDSRLRALNDARCQYNREDTIEDFDVRIRLYENVQNLHSIHESLNLVALTLGTLKPIADLADLPRLSLTQVFISKDFKKEADNFFERSGVKNQIITQFFSEISKQQYFDIGILESVSYLKSWQFRVKAISRLLKNNSLLWIFGKLNTDQTSILKREGFKQYTPNKNTMVFKFKELSKKICLLFWRFGLFPLPYLTLKPPMELVPNLSSFIRGWQGNSPYLI